MKNLIYISTGIIFSIMIQSCQFDPIVSTDEIHQTDEDLQNNSVLSARSDSTICKETDPPKDRDHWRPSGTYNNKR
ncbi:MULTISPECIES: hypothetical protein [unclassified Chryseobacterium]|uniref:hypothetical protein n=1 Tax=unclassified Chryseobacterium TaxID=2593645 RepID=UPI00100B8295|nr:MULTISPECIES: hypothetical protein [unclassified Chryseobacterium]